jgi:hypothetical protein
MKWRRFMSRSLRVGGDDQLIELSGYCAGGAPFGEPHSGGADCRAHHTSECHRRPRPTDQAYRRRARGGSQQRDTVDADSVNTATSFGQHEERCERAARGRAGHAKPQGRHYDNGAGKLRLDRDLFWSGHEQKDHAEGGAGNSAGDGPASDHGQQSAQSATDHSFLVWSVYQANARAQLRRLK